jgi:hypothetical protein
MVIAGWGCLLALSAAAQTNVTWIYCKAELFSDAGNSNLQYAVELAPTPGYEPYCVWLPGKVAVGGTADSWYDASGPASFAIRNTGTARCDIWICAESVRPCDTNAMLGPVFCGNWLGDLSFPSADPNQLDPTYSLAVAVTVTGIAPQWRLLDQPMRTNDIYFTQFGARMAAGARAGDTVPFDLKYYAPRIKYGTQTVDAPFIAAFYAVPVWPEETPSVRTLIAGPQYTGSKYP